MKLTIQSVLKYAFFLGIAALLLYLVYGNQDFGKVIEDTKSADPVWITVSIIMALISHLSRGWRWRIALQPSGFNLHPLRAFLAVMVGYFANLFVPRMGEIARCGILKKTDNIPVNISFGAVIAERALDLTVLLTLTIITVFIEFDRIGTFLTERLELGVGSIPKNIIVILLVLGLLGLVFIFLVYKNRNRLRNLPGYTKIAEFLIGLKEGLFSITQLNNSQKAGYVFHTIVIWLMYYTMTYALFFTQEQTSHLSMLCALSVFIMGGIGIVIPTPGGIGSYHLFVGTTLIAYGLPEADSKAFAFLMHSTQTIAILAAGGISLLISSFLKSKSEDVMV